MDLFKTKIEYLKEVGLKKAAILNEELNIFTFEEMLQYYPFRYEDRSRFYKINEIREHFPYVQLKGKIISLNIKGEGIKRRLIAKLKDETGIIDLVWFHAQRWISSQFQTNITYVIFGKPINYNNHFSIVHPEFEIYAHQEEIHIGLQPIYHTSDKMKKNYISTKTIAKIQLNLLSKLYDQIPESLPNHVINKYGFLSKKEAIANVHFPKETSILNKAKERLKFEELFYIQLKLLKSKFNRKNVKSKGQIFNNTSTLHIFYKKYLPFELTLAQKRVIKEIYKDLQSGYQMNRLLQGDVGSGKTLVAFICALTAIDNHAQVCMMAPTETLAEQHYNTLKVFTDKLHIPIARLTGSTRKKQRQNIDEALRNGKLKIIVGTHALLEDKVEFHNLGLCIIDEQHRFGVAQRAKLWNKKALYAPHILVMTATPIPRTLAMTLYGDLDVSIINQLPKGRKPIVTTHRYDSDRTRIWNFINKQIKKGRQIYIVYPLIEESEKLDYRNLEEGYESVKKIFPDYSISILHGRMKSEDKDYEMQCFMEGEKKIMVTTTVIEVGVDVPNATVMVIENAERFGLAQLHQLRGRVGRSTHQSYCILLSNYKLSKESKLRLETICNTNDGFEIANVDLKIRGPGDLTGTQQSGILNLQFANLGKDSEILEESRKVAKKILQKDPMLEKKENDILKLRLEIFEKQTSKWSKIS